MSSPTVLPRYSPSTSTSTSIIGPQRSRTRFVRHIPTSPLAYPLPETYPASATASSRVVDSQQPSTSRHYPESVNITVSRGRQGKPRSVRSPSFKSVEAKGFRIHLRRQANMIARQLAISTDEVKQSLTQIRMESVRRGKNNAQKALKEVLLAKAVTDASLDETRRELQDVRTQLEECRRDKESLALENSMLAEEISDLRKKTAAAAAVLALSSSTSTYLTTSTSASGVTSASSPVLAPLPGPGQTSRSLHHKTSSTSTLRNRTVRFAFLLGSDAYLDEILSNERLHLNVHGSVGPYEVSHAQVQSPSPRRRTRSQMTHSANTNSTYLDVPGLPMPALPLYPAPSLSPIPQSPHVFGGSSNPNVNSELEEPDAYDSDVSPGLTPEPVIPPFAGHVSFLSDLEGHAGLASPKKPRTSGLRNRKSSTNSIYSSAPSVHLSPSIISHSPSLKVIDLGLGPEIETDFFDDLPCGPQTPTLRAPAAMRLRRAMSYSTFSPGSSMSTAASFVSTEAQTPLEREGDRDREKEYGFPPLPPAPAPPAPIQMQMQQQQPVRQRRITLATSGTGNSASGEMDKQRFAPHSSVVDANVQVPGHGRLGHGGQQQQQRRGPVVPLTISISRPFETSPSRPRGDRPLPVVPSSSSTSASTSINPHSRTAGAGASVSYDSIPVPMTAVSVESSTPTITVSAVRRSSSATAASASVSLPVTGAGAGTVRSRPAVPPRNPNRPRSFMSVSAVSDCGTELPAVSGGAGVDLSHAASGVDAPPRPSISTESTVSSLAGPFLTPPEYAEYDTAFAHPNGSEHGAAAGSHAQNGGGQTLEMLCMSPVSEYESTTSAASSPVMPLTPEFSHHGQHHRHSLPLPLPLPVPLSPPTMNPLPRPPPRSPLRVHATLPPSHV